MFLQATAGSSKAASACMSDAAGASPMCRVVWVPSWDKLVGVGGVTFLAVWHEGAISFFAPRPMPTMLQGYPENYALKQEQSLLNPR